MPVIRENQKQKNTSHKISFEKRTKNKNEKQTITMIYAWRKSFRDVLLERKSYKEALSKFEPREQSFYSQKNVHRIWDAGSEPMTLYACANRPEPRSSPSNNGVLFFSDQHAFTRSGNLSSRDWRRCK